MALLRRKRDDAVDVAVEEVPVAVPMNEAHPRERTCVIGQVTRMTARPTSGQPALAVSISDGTATVTAVWTGQRTIGGITLGRRLAVEGVPILRGSQLEFTNPRYTLLGR